MTDLHGYADAGHGWMYGGCEDPWASAAGCGAMPIIAMTANAFADDRRNNEGRTETKASGKAPGYGTTAVGTGKMAFLKKALSIMKEQRYNGT